MMSPAEGSNSEGHHTPQSAAPEPSLAGCHVVLAGARKGEEFTAPLRRRGVRVTVAAALSYVDLLDDPLLRESFDNVLAKPVDFTLVTTGVGWRGVLAAAESLGCMEPFLAQVGASRVLTRGAKARGGAAGSGLSVEYSAPTETSAELIEHLRMIDLSGKRVVIQHHGSGSDDLDEAVLQAGGHPIDLIAYRTAPAPDPAAVDAAIGEVIAGGVDVIAFTSAPLFENYLRAADKLGVRAEFIAALSDGRCAPAGFGELTAQPMLDAGLSPLLPQRSRLGALVKTITTYLESTREERTV